MNNRLITAIIMCYICAALLWLNTADWIVSIIIVTASSIALKIRFKAKIRPFVYMCGSLLLATFFVAKHQLTLLSDDQDLIAQNLLLLNFCECLIFAMVISIIVRQSDHIAPWFAVCGILTMVLLDKIDNSTSRLEYIFMLLNVACAAVFWFSPGTNAKYIGITKTKNIAVLAIIALAVTANILCHDTLYRQYRSGLKHLFANRGILGEIDTDQEHRVGFSLASNKVATSKIKSDGGNQIVAQVFSEKCPKYLIGKVYDQYNNGSWDSKDEYGLILPDKRFASDNDKKVFVLDPLSIENKGNVFEIHPLQYFDGVVFSVPDTVAVSIDADSLLCNNWGDILCHNAKDQSYKVYSSDSKHQNPPLDDAVHRLTSVPDEVRKELNDIAVQIFSGHHTTAEKIRALHKYWEDAKYSLDLNIPNGSEPVIYLVKNRPPAHCELYASAACMLLRLANVPVRYATGFAVSDQQDGYWAVQNKDAHAWAQVWDAENRKWIDFDIAANSTGQPEISYSQNKSLPISQRFKASWLNSGIKGVAMLSTKIIADFCGGMAKNTVFVSSLIFIVIMLTAILAHKACRHKKFSANGSEIERLQKKLRKMDTLLQKRGLKRKLSETPIQFAQRLAQQGPCYNDRNEHIRWYKRYSQIRYSEKTQTMSSSLTDN